MKAAEADRLNATRLATEEITAKATAEEQEHVANAAAQQLSAVSSAVGGAVEQHPLARLPALLAERQVALTAAADRARKRMTELMKASFAAYDGPAATAAVASLRIAIRSSLLFHRFHTRNHLP